MVRFAPLVAPGTPHRINKRGNRRQATFFPAEESQEYLTLMGAWCRAYVAEVWAFWLVPSHVHLIVMPASEDGLRRAIGEARRRYTRQIDFREAWRGHLWQGCFAS